jgi:hypothetical protein
MEKNQISKFNGKNQWQKSMAISMAISMAKSNIKKQYQKSMVNSPSVNLQS